MCLSTEKAQRIFFTFCKTFETLKCDLELVLVGGFGRVVEHVDSEKRYNRHDEKSCSAG